MIVTEQLSSIGKTLDKNIPTSSKPFEFASEKRKRIAKELKEAFGFSHGGTKKKKKKK